MKLILGVLRLLLQWAYKVEVEGIENLKYAGDRVLIVANHTSFLDAVLLTLFLPGKASFAIHSSYYHRWWMQPVKKVANLFAVDHTDPMAIKSLIAHVKEGHSVIVFPEGRITATGSLMKVYPGPGMLADKADAAIVPIRISGAQYTPFSRLRWFPKIKLTILPSKKLQFPEGMSGRERRRKAGKTLADIMTEMVFETTPYRRRLWDALLESSHVHGAKHVVLEDVERNPLNYRDVFTRSFLLGDLFKEDFQKDERVGVLLPNVSACAVTFFALQSQGMVPAMLNYTMGEKAVIAAIKTATIKTVITSHKFIETAGLECLVAAMSQHTNMIYLEDVRERVSTFKKIKAAFVARDPEPAIARRLQGVNCEDAAVVLFTSGSEGMPKAVVLSHKNILANIAQIASRMAMTPHDVCLNALPMFHSFGLTAGTILPLLGGMKLFLYPSPLHYRVIPEVAYDINATLMFGTNVFLSAYAKHAHPYDFYSLRYVIAGAEKLHEDTRQAWIDKFGIRILEGYGTTETSPVLSVNTPMDYQAGSVGRLLPGIESKVEAVPGVENGGRLWVKGENVMSGYMFHDSPGQLQPPKDGWYDTGDIVEFDEEGFMHIQGRAKRFAKVAGEMISLTAVEEMADLCWPEYNHVALAFPDFAKGESVVLLSNHEGLKREPLLTFAKAEGINELYVPKVFVNTEEIPLMGSGKIHYLAAQEIAAGLMK
ncbi:MAG: AMP-binding protein [Mariprofundaceae bacterium]